MTRKRFLTINPQIRDYFGSIKTALVFGSLEYWCNKKPNGFYKFKQRCLKHDLYKNGDSWGEELDMKRKVLDPILARLVTSYSSKTDFLKAKDKFKGKIFVSYYQRNTAQTFYFMDREALDAFYSKLDTKRPPSSATLSNAPFSLDKNPLGNVPKNLPFAHALNTNTNTHNKTTLSEVELISRKMIDTWNSHLPHKAIWYKSLASKLFQILQDFFKGCLETFKRYCLTCASADFLTGKAKNSSFKAYLFWAIKPEIIQSIRDGAYGVKSFFTLQDPEERKLKEDFRNIDYEIKAIDHKISHHREEIIEGQKKLISDLKAAVSVEEMHTLRVESDENFNQTYPNSPKDRWLNMLLDNHFEDFLNKKLKECAGITDEIIIPQHLLDVKECLEAERKRISKKLDQITKGKQSLKYSLAFEN